MPLNFGQASSTNSDSDAGPGIYLNFSGKSGRWSVQDNTGQEKVKKEIKPTAFVADFDNLQTGWYKLAAGEAPNVKIDPSLDTPAQQPSPEHKRGFQVNCYSKQLGGVARFSSSSQNVCAVIGDLYTQYEAGRQSGKLPVIEITGDEAVTNKRGDVNYRPVMKIAKWVDRPAELKAETAPAEKFDDAPFGDIGSSLSEF